MWMRRCQPHPGFPTDVRVTLKWQCCFLARCWFGFETSPRFHRGHFSPVSRSPFWQARRVSIFPVPLGSNWAREFIFLPFLPPLTPSLQALKDKLLMWLMVAEIGNIKCKYWSVYLFKRVVWGLFLHAATWPLEEPWLCCELKGSF